MRASDTPPAVDDRRDRIAERLADAPGVLLCLDFDGTLAPIVEEPDDAAMAPDCRPILDGLAEERSVEVAVVSGRAIDDLRDRVDLDDVVYAGNHGLELQRGERTEVVPEADEQRRAIDEVCADVAERTASIPGVTVEHKGVTATVHYRQVPGEGEAAVVDAVEAAVADADADFEVLDGKQIREIRPRVDWDKGRVVELLAEDVPDDWEEVYVGDDTTDEDAFEVVEPDGLGVLVGDDADTAASMRVRDREDVATLLELIADAQDGTGER